MKTILLSALMLATLVGCGNEDYSKAISDNESRLDAIESNMDKRLDALLGVMRGNQSNLDKRLRSYETQLDSISSLLTNYQSDLFDFEKVVNDHFSRMDQFDRRDEMLFRLIMASINHDAFAEFNRVVSTTLYGLAAPKEHRLFFGYDAVTTFVIEAERYIYQVHKIRPNTDISRAAEEIVNAAKEYKAAFVWEENPDWTTKGKTEQELTALQDNVLQKLGNLYVAMKKYFSVLAEDYTPPKDEDDDGIVA